MTAISPENSTGQVHDLDGDEQEHNADEFVDNEFASGEAVIGTNENGSKGNSTRKPFDVGFRKRVKPTYFSVSQQLLTCIWMLSALITLHILSTYHFFHLSQLQDKHGNLKAVNTVIRHPFKIFLFLIVLCLVLSFLLNLLVFCTAENNNPFTPPSNEFDLNDVRSIQYDSLRLARDEVAGGRKAVSKEGQTVEKQSELAAM